VPPVLRVSAAWLFLLAGLLLAGAVMLVPAWRDVETVRFERDRLEAAAAYQTRRLAATRHMRTALSRPDAALQQRLIAWQLNLLPADQTAVARELHAGGILGWIDSTVEPLVPPPPPPQPTPLEKLVSGPRRLWVLAGAAVMIFVGLIGLPSADNRYPEAAPA
jgi:hypothetical protein